MTDIIKAMNPTAPLNTEEAATAAAKVSAVGILAGALNQVIGGWYASTPAAQEAAARMVEDLTGQVTPPEQLAQQAQIGLAMTGVLVLIQLVLAFVQWRKPNIVLPILFLVLVIWALGGAVLGLVMPMFAAAQPMWLSGVILVLMLFAAVTHIAGIRGASALSKLRFQAANTYED